MKILVTGAKGMVGQNIVEHSKIAAHQLLQPSRAELDLFSYSAVSDYLQKHKPDLVIHCAGRVGGIQANMAHPVEFLVENLDINRNVILASYKNGVQRLINMGSSCMYPRNAENPLREEFVLQGELEPTNEGYALAKISAQRLCQYIGKENSEFKYKTLIPCNLYGRYDKFSPQHSHLVPAVIRKMHLAKVNNEKQVEIWGDGTARREFMFAADVADAVSFAIDGDGKNFQTMPELLNIGLGHDYSVNDYYKTVAEVVGYTGGFFHNLDKPTGMKQKCVSVDRATNWGWKSKTSLLEGLKETYQFFLKTEIQKGL